MAKLKANQREIFSRRGRKVIVDISDGACILFGFKHRDKIIHPAFGKFIVSGVGSDFSGTDVLWLFKKGKDRASFLSPGDLKKSRII